jgi:hypothetical protein
MAHFAELDENNIVTRVLVTDTNDPNGDEGYQWLVDNLGGTWVKTSYNTFFGEHKLGGTPFRGNFGEPGFVYVQDIDMFLPQKPYSSWIPFPEEYKWQAPVSKPDGGLWKWDEESLGWIEGFPPEDEL